MHIYFKDLWIYKIIGNVVISFGVSSLAGAAVNRFAAGVKASSLKKLTNNLGNRQLKAMMQRLTWGLMMQKLKVD